MTVALGIDQARRSGWAICDSDHGIVLSGVATKCPHRILAIQRAILWAADRARPLVVVVEDHSRIPLKANRTKRATATILGMGEARGRWLEICELLGLPWCAVPPSEWRPRVLGISPYTHTSPAKAAAIRWARDRGGAEVSDDEAEAQAIAWWGAHGPVARAQARLIDSGRASVQIGPPVLRPDWIG